MIGKRKKKKTNRRIDDDDPDAAAHPVFEDDDMVIDILTRLPAKSVFQAKSVCKNWLSLVRDPHFIDLHFQRSKARPRFFFVSQSKHKKPIGIRYEGFERRVCFQTTDLVFEEHNAQSRKIRKDSAVHAVTENLFCYHEILAVNGLICFVNNLNRAACVYNVSTREITSWIQSGLRGELGEDWEHDANHDTGFGFGFDPVRKDYKVICQSTFSRKVEDGTYKRIEVWEVLKLGDNAWRRIEEAPGLRLGSAPLNMHVNGTIYWFPSRDSANFCRYLLAFDVGTEKFRIIPIPKYIGDQILNSNEVFDYWFHLLQVDGCVAVLRRMSSYDVKLFIFHDNFKEESSEAGNSDAGDRNWTEESVRLPLECTVSSDPHFDTVVGTDQIILEIHRKNIDEKEKNDVYLYTWNREDKTFEEMHIRGFPSSIHFDRFYASLGVPFTENLLPLHTFNQPGGA